MNILKDKILNCGTILPNSIIKVDSFLNHQLDVKLIEQIGCEFAKLFTQYKPTKILTIEASGIAIAYATALQLGGIDVVYAKKMAANIGYDNVYTADVFSFTKRTTNTVVVSKQYLQPTDNILIIDDFLANGEALNGLIEIVKASRATLVGCGIVIEKGFQQGGQRLRSQGVNLKSLAIIDSIDDDKITFRD